MPSQKPRITVYLEDEMAQKIEAYSKRTGLKAPDVLHRAIDVLLGNDFLFCRATSSLVAEVQQAASDGLRTVETQVLIDLAKTYGQDPAEVLQEVQGIENAE